MQGSKEDKKTVPFAERSNSVGSTTSRQGEKRSVVFNQNVQDQQRNNIASVSEITRNAPNTSNQMMTSSGQNTTQKQQQQSLPTGQQQQQTQDSLHQILPYNQDMMRSVASIIRNNSGLPVESNFPVTLTRGLINISAPVPTQIQSANCQMEPLYNCLATLISNILPLVTKEQQPPLPPVDPNSLYVGLPCTAGPCCIKNFLKTPAKDLKSCCFNTSRQNAPSCSLKKSVFMSDPVENPKATDASQTVNGVIGQSTDAVQTALPERKAAKAIETQNSTTSTSAVSNSAKSLKETTEKEEDSSTTVSEKEEKEEPEVLEGMLSKTVAGDPRFLMMAKVRRAPFVTKKITPKKTLGNNNYPNKKYEAYEEDDDDGSTFDDGEEIPPQPRNLKGTTGNSIYQNDPEYDETFHTEVSSMVRGKVSHYTEFSTPKHNYRTEQNGQDQMAHAQERSSSPKPVTGSMVNSESLILNIPPKKENRRNPENLTKQRKSKGQIAQSKDNRPTRTSSRKKDGNGILSIDSVQKESKDTKRKK